MNENDGPFGKREPLGTAPWVTLRNGGGTAMMQGASPGRLAEMSAGAAGFRVIATGEFDGNMPPPVTRRKYEDPKPSS